MQLTNWKYLNIKFFYLFNYTMCDIKSLISIYKSFFDDYLNIVDLKI